MKEVKHYVCEICGTEYSDKVKAQTCEKNHKKPVRMKDCRYLSNTQNQKGYPISINVEMEDGNIITYKH